MREIQTGECKLSMLITIIVSFTVSAYAKLNGPLIEYSFGFPCQYWTIYQGNKNSYKLFWNLFDGNKGMNINILGFFANVFIIYGLLLLLKKIYIKIKTE